MWRRYEKTLQRFSTLSRDVPGQLESWSRRKRDEKEEEDEPMREKRDDNGKSRCYDHSPDERVLHHPSHPAGAYE